MEISGREVSDEILRKVIGAAFKAPTNDHLRQLEFVVVRGRENIAKVVAPLAKNMASFRELVFEVDESGDRDKMAMFADALTKQQKMLMDSGLLIIPFFCQKTCPLLEPVEQSSLNYFASAWCAVENMLLAAANEGLVRGVPHPRGRRGRQHKESGQCPRRLRVCLSSHNRLSRRKRFSPKAEGNQYRGQNTCECLVTGKNETEGAQSGMDIYFPMRTFRKFPEHSAGFGVLSYCLQKPRRQSRRGGREKAL